MIDSSKRKTLLSLGGMMAIPFVPAMVSANYYSELSVDSTEQFVSVTDGELDIQLMFNDAPMMKVTNTTDSLTILRQIHPGIVHVGGTSYDLNKSLLSSAYAVGAGQSRVIPLIEAAGAPAEPELAARYGRRPTQVASITSYDKHNSPLSSAQAVFT